MIPENCEITEISALLEAKKISSVELCELLTQRIKEHQHLNAFVTLTDEEALEQAKLADQLRVAGNHSPWAGIPLAHKDIFCTKGTRTTCASKILDNFVSPYDATVVSLLKEAGLISLGKTNMDEFAMGSSSEHSCFAPVKNPWNTARVAGGSSGGSAAAVAAGLVPAATGTDTGGSIRQPAAFCGITGLKPSYGRVSRFGMIAFASSLDQGGVLTRSAKDAALLMDIIGTFDPRDSTSLDIPSAGSFEQLDRLNGGFTIGIPKEFFGPGLDNEVARAVQDALLKYEAMGAKLIDIELPGSEAAIACYYVIAPAEASSNLSRFDGVRYGHRSENASDLQEMYKNTRTEGFGAEVRRRIMIGTYVLSHGYYDAYYVKAQQVRRLISDEFQQAFEECDVIMGPTTPTPAFELGSKTDDPVLMYLNDVYTAPINLAGLPAISIPAGFVNGLPVGLQIIGKYMDESFLLQVAHRFQMETDYHKQTPKVVLS